ncbi:MAG: fibronectin-binding autotransporter adhesin [Blastocatellia bacterium]|nr:fibronectin-binding autotransporter adhesin [Blastocatellia bacterium]
MKWLRRAALSSGTVKCVAECAGVPRALASLCSVIVFSLLPLVFICLVSTQSSARTITTSINWSALSPVPDATEGMIIKNSATVTVDVSNAVANTISMGAGGASPGPGTLKFNAGSVLTLSGTAGTLTLGLSATNSGTIDMALGGTVHVKGFLGSNGFLIPGSGSIDVTGTTTLLSFISTYNNLTVNVPGGSVTFGAAPTINGNLIVTAGTLSANNLNSSVHGNWTNNSATSAFTAGTSTVTFNGTSAESIGGSFATTFNNLTVSNTGNTVTSGVNSSIVGNLAVSSGTFDLGNFTANRTTAGGTLAVANSATLKIGGTNSFPTNYTTNTLVVASTVEYSGTNQTVTNQTYGNLKLSSSSGAAVKTFPGTALAVVGNLSSVLGTGTSVSFTAASIITVNGNVSLGASTTFNGGSYSHSIGGNWATSGTFNGDTGTITFTGSGSAVSGSGTQNFNNLTVAASAVTFSSGSITLTGNLATTGSGSVSQASGGTLLMSGSGKTIGGSGISLDNLTVGGSVSTAISLTLTGNLSVSGSVSASGGTITMSGAGKTISGAGTRTFYILSVTGSLTSATNFSIASGLTVSGSLSASAGTATFTGTSTLSGTANLFNTTINGTSLQLSANSTLGIAGVLTITAGILNVTSSAPNTINFNGTGAQNINAITYNNLVMSNGNSKTALAGLTVNRNITIGTGTTFVAGSFTHSIYEDWTNSGSFTAGTGTIQFLGNHNTNITGATTFNILTVNNATSATGLVLQSNISAATVNMTLGTMLTGAYTVTITVTRTGNGDIVGNIQRTHSFTTGIAYAFESPNNTITFSSVSAVTSITVSITDGSISDFPFTSSLNEQTTIAIPAGTYNATLRLDYDEDELNGNNESTMTLWRYNGSAWVSSGKTANDTTLNYVEQSGLTSIANRWTLANSSAASVVQWNGSVSTDWNTAANWTVLQGSPSRPPAATDIVNLGTAAFTYQPTISSTVSVKNINFGSAQALTLSMATGGSLTSTNVTGTWSGSATHTINANNQSITVNGDLSLSDGVSGHAINLSIGTGTVNVVQSLTQSGGANIVFSGAGNLNIIENYNYVSGTFTAGTGTVTYNGPVDQLVGAVSYNNLTINKAAGLASINNAVSVSGNLLIASSELDNLSTTTISGNVTINSGGILENNGAIHVGGNWTNSGTYVAEGFGVFFDGTGTQYISASNFGTLNINKPSGTAILTGELTVGGNLIITSGTLDLRTYSITRNSIGGFASIADGATGIIGGNNGPSDFATYTLGAASTVIYNGTDPQYISSEGISFGNLIFTNAGTKTLVTPLAPSGNLTIDSGATLDGSAYAITANGNWINNGTFTPSTSTVIFTGTTKTISGSTTFNQAVVSGSYTILGNNNFNGLLNITSTGSLSGGGTVNTTLNGDLLNSGVLNALGTTTFSGTALQTLSLINATTTVALTVNFNGSVSPVLNSTAAPQFGYININNTGGVNPSVGWNISYGLTVGSGASFNGGTSSHNILGSLTNNGTITSNGIVSFLPSSAATVNLGSNFSSTDRVYFGGSGAMTLVGTPVSFRNINVTNTNAAGITPSSDWTITKDLTVASGSILNAGNHSYSVARNIANSGTINSGTSTFILNGAGDQDISSGSTFNNLTINKASGAATLSANATVSGVLNFVAGKIQTGSNLLIQPSSGTLTGAAQNTGWVNGQLQKNVATGATNKTFEVGGPNNYTPVTVTFAGVSVAGDLIASAVSGDHASISSSTINAAKSVNRTWTLSNSGIGFTNYSATFNFVAGDIDAGASTGAFIVGKYSGGSWTYPTVGTRTSTSTQATGLTSFSDFQVGGTAAIPNVTLIGSVSPTGFVRPHTDLVYTFGFVNNGVGPAFALVITDPIPANTDFKLGSVTTSLGTTGLTPTIAYSRDSGATWSYTPVSTTGGAPAGYDRTVTNVRWSFGSTLSRNSPDNSGSVSFTVRIR